MRTVFYILLTFGSYSFGATIANRRTTDPSRQSPGMIDTMVAAVLCALAFVERGRLQGGMILLWLPAASVCGAVVRWLGSQGSQRQRGGSGDFVTLAADHSLPGTRPQRAWRAWRRLGQEIADFQVRVVINGVYYLLVAPFGMLVRYRKDPLGMRHSRSASHWTRRPTTPEDLPHARRQFQ